MKKLGLLLLLSTSLASAAEWQVIGWNDLGMHCMDGTDFSVFSILPPYNTIHAQVIHNGDLVTSSSGLHVTFEAVADPEGSINTTSADKVNFWEHVADMFGAQPADDVGLTGVAMPGTNNTPQHMEFEPAHNWFTGEGIPISPFDDAGKVNYYPLMKVVLRNDVGTELASTRIVLPVSDEMTCSACHQSGSGNDAMPALGWRWHPDADKDVKLNILRLHDEKQQGNAAFFLALENQGFNTNGLYQTVVADGTAILCARCHSSNALPGLGETGVPPLTQVMHGHHGAVMDPATGMTLNDSANRSSCYRCHPGSDTLCLRGAMGTAVDESGSTSMQCQSCHGNMSTVGSATRVGWLEQPNCQACHTGTATDNNGQIRYLDAYDGGSLRVPVNPTFATSPDTPAAGFSLYRFSEGHGDLQCSACHGSPHAIYPSFHQNDNLQNQDLQGQGGTLGDCSVCHADSQFSEANNLLSGPHGMHQTGSRWIKQGDHNHKKAVDVLGANSCKACHGADERGTVLSASLTDQTLSWSDDGQTANKFFWQGAIISCYSCHEGSNSDNDNPRVAATVSSISAVISANTDAVMPLSISNPSGLDLFTRIISPPRYGMAAVSNGTHAVYRPFYNFTGTDQFTYAAYNTEKDSNLATGTVTVAEGTCVLVCESLVPAKRGLAHGASVLGVRDRLELHRRRFPSLELWRRSRLDQCAGAARLRQEWNLSMEHRCFGGWIACHEFGLGHGLRHPT